VASNSGAIRVLDPNSLERLLTDTIRITQDGYLHVYVSNGSSASVSFDNFLVSSIQGNVRQINHYYPYGLSIAGLSQLPTRYLHGYQGKELFTRDWNVSNPSGLEMYDFHARLYDPQLGRWFAHDPAEQFSNPYLAMGNNPVSYVDPDGEFIFTVAALIAAPFTAGASLELLPYAIGADIGVWQGGTIANGTANPVKWDYSSGRTWAYMAGGAVVGAASAGAGHGVAASGVALATTKAIMVGSAINSMGTYMYTGGQTDVSISFGAASYNLTQNEWGYLGKKGNSTLENIGFSLGALANVSDVLAGFRPGEVQLNTDASDAVGHNAITTVGERNPSSIISFGPNRGGKWIFNPFKFKDGTNNWNNYVDKNGTWKTVVEGVNVKRLNSYGGWLDKSVNYNLFCSSCVNHAARALTLSGVPVIGIHPLLLHSQVYLRSIGFRPSMYSYLLNQ